MISAVSQHATLPVSRKHIGFSLSGSSVFLNEPLNPPLSTLLCIGTACFVDFIVFAQVIDFLPQEQTTEKKPKKPTISGILFGSVKTDNKNESDFDLIFRAEGIIIHEMD